MILSKRRFLPVLLSSIISISLVGCFHDEAEEDHHHDDTINLTLDAAEVISNPLSTGEIATASLMFHEVESELTGTVTYTGTTAIAALHVHEGFAGQSGDVLITLVNDDTDTNKWNIPDDEASLIVNDTLEAGGYYLNAHFADGKTLRAQILNHDVVVRVAALAAHDGVTTTGGGFVGVTVNMETHNVKAYARVTGLTDIKADPGGVHLHIEDASNANAELISLSEDTDVASGDLDATANEKAYKIATAEMLSMDDLMHIGAARWYINVHTDTNAAGELKGSLAAIEHAH